MELLTMKTNELTKQDILTWQNTFDSERKAHVNSKTKANRILSICGDLLILKAAKKIGINERLSIKRTAYGKPYFENSPYHFSVSHKLDMAVCAISSHPIGVDIENIKPFKSATAKRICTEQELIYINGDCERFATVWTIKEAYSKLDSRGISLGLSNIITDMAAGTVNGVPFSTLRLGDYICTIVSEE